MCGIFACLHCTGKDTVCPKAAISGSLQRRGPDIVRDVSVPLTGGQLQLDMLGTLLCMRGEPTPLPLGNDAGDWLLWNGNVFGGGIRIGEGENDTVKVLEELASAHTPTAILSVLGMIHGPWSFVFWQASSQSLWFGRDVFGRRSLLWHLPQSEEGGDCLAISSVGNVHPTHTPSDYWLEVPAIGIFQLVWKESSCLTMKSASLLCYLWMQGGHTFQSEEGIAHELDSLKTFLPMTTVRGDNPLVSFPPMNKSTDSESESTDTSPHTAHRASLQESNSAVADVEHGIVTVTYHDHVSRLLELLLKAVEHRVSKAPPVISRFKSSGCEVEATTVDGGGGTTGLGVGGGRGGTTGLGVGGGGGGTTGLGVVGGTGGATGLGVGGGRGGTTGLGVGGGGGGTTGLGVVGGTGGATVGGGRGSTTGLGVVGGDYSDSVLRGRARVAILFSGGVDSAVLAALADRCMDPAEEIDLINVAFEQKHLPEHDPTRFDVPDRVSGLACLRELNQKRKWNFIMVNVTLNEVNKMRSERISQLVYPHNTVLDDSIGCALWFAARGQGLLYSNNSSKRQLYKSSARTLLSGIGADEQLAGYARHRTKFRTGGLSAVIEEVEMDIKRLAKRNFGRDDRCTADHQRDAQYPFLDEQVVAYLQCLPMTVKADLSQPRGVGEKRLLRQVAAALHCTTAAALPKRAIQFGSRMAKLNAYGSSGGREHGRDTCDRLFSK